MKKSLIPIVCLVLTVLTLSFGFSPDNRYVSAKETSVSQNDSFSESEVLKARFLNMLNHNFVYNEAIYFEEDIVNCSVLALLNLRDSQDDSYINESFVSNYVYNMYGIESIDYSKINSEFEQKEGYVYIIPRGYSMYSHNIISVEKNEDNSYTVISNVKISSHDCEEYSDICETLFIKNDNSEFGYNIINSVIGSKNQTI